MAYYKFYIRQIVCLCRVEWQETERVTGLNTETESSSMVLVLLYQITWCKKRLVKTLTLKRQYYVTHTHIERQTVFFVYMARICKNSSASDYNPQFLTVPYIRTLSSVDCV